MKTLMKLKEYLKRSITFFVMAGTESLLNENLTLQVKNKQLNNGRTTILGKSFTMDELGDLSDGIMLMMYLQAVTTYDDFSYSNTMYDIDEYIYSKNNIGFYCNDVRVGNIIIAENDINIYSTNLNSDECTIIYSKNGDINIGVSKMEFNGIIYAPNGSINIDASDVEIRGAIVCENLTTSTGTFKCVGTVEGQKIYNMLVSIINDTSIEVDVEVTDDELFKVTYESNKQLEKLDIYLRVDNSDKYQFYMELPEEGEFVVDMDFTYLDIAFVGHTILGETEKSNVESFDIYNDGIEYYYCDTDNDDISDGEEVWFLNTSPQNVDTDEDGFSDYYECIVLCSNPTEYTEDADYDKDGLLNSEEQKNGTNPLLRDSDFDGVLDKEDSRQYYCDEVKDIDYEQYNIAIGMLDKVTTSVNNKMELVQSVYNPFTRITKQYGYGNVVGKVFFDNNERKCAELILVGDEYRINTYSYDDNDNIVQMVNNGDIYEYKYLEDGGVKGVYINGKQILGYDSESEKITYANGDAYNVAYDEKNDLYELMLNDAPLMSSIQNQYGEMKYCNNIISGVEYSYEYYENGYVKSAEYNNMFLSNYIYDEDTTTINYYDEKEQYQQINYVAEEDCVEVSLITGNLLSKYDKDNVLSYAIFNEDMVIQDTEYIYEGDNIVKITYSDGLEYEYKYNFNSQITKVVENGKVIKEYEYYDNGQLYKEKDVVSGKTYTYSYDCYNNIKSVNTYYEENLIIDEAYEYNSDLWNDVLSSFCGGEIVYDEIGNPIEYYDGTTFTWNARELSGANKDGKNITYAYNYDGMRNYKNVNGKETFYFVEGEDVVAEKTGEDIIWYIYDDNNDVFGFMLNGVAYYYDKNATKDVIRVLDASGEIVCEYTYDAWGNVINVEGDNKIAEINPIRYRSYYYDEDIDMYYLETRFYDSCTRRFLNADNMLRVKCNDMDYNLYAYCGGDPVNLYDPTGQAVFYYVSMFCVTEFEDYCEQLQYDIRECLDATMTWDLEKGSSNGDLTNWWNNLGYRDLAVIYSHGLPEWIIMDSGNMNYSNGRVLSDLQKQDVKLLVILGCNTGHFDYGKSIARAFANKITGKVVASDGSVLVHNEATYSQVWFESIATAHFQSLCIAATGNSRSRYGWLVYVGTNIGDYGSRIYFLDNTRSGQLTVGTICNLVMVSSFYNSFK